MKLLTTPERHVVQHTIEISVPDKLSFWRRLFNRRPKEIETYFMGQVIFNDIIISATNDEVLEFDSFVNPIPELKVEDYIFYNAFIKSKLLSDDGLHHLVIAFDYFSEQKEEKEHASV